MDYRKNMNTPRDMIDEELLLRLLREKEPSAAVFGGNVRRESRRRSSAGTGNCGCRQTRERECPRERSQEYRQDCRQGCREEPTSEPTRCGCGCHEHSPEYDYDRRDREDSPCEPCANDERMRHFVLAMAYVPIQEWEMLHDEETALSRGTLFEALDLPWHQSACEDQRESSCRKCGGSR